MTCTTAEAVRATCWSPARNRAEVQQTLADVRARIRLDYDDASDVAPMDLADRRST